ncbi:hypothetical protein UPYG_G00014180 [Umbra pygmaea]|uniref:Uncharacterized protein n=1 Tax=Umbra pygmaea TaxID=75934 RepID=A0ABD0XLL9_UMBPY
MNHYANKKSVTESMLDLALLMANASQLKAVLEQGPDVSLYTPLITLISLSLSLQVAVGVLLIFIGEGDNVVSLWGTLLEMCMELNTLQLRQSDPHNSVEFYTCGLVAVVKTGGKLVLLRVIYF